MWRLAGRAALAAVLAAAGVTALAAGVPESGRVAAAIDHGDDAVLREIGHDVLPVMAELYRNGDRDRRVAVARAWYRLGWRSEEAKAALLADLGTRDSELRLEVQWALGRVSADPEVVRRLLETMRTDVNPLFRDKAACALVSDQIHLTPEQRLAQFGGLIEALTDEEPQVRSIAIQALKILTGQAKGFQPAAPPDQRAAAIARWRQWLDDYRESL
ncbi:MAG: hypothetical protein K8I65_10735 [Thermoanaerobaculia bacterium]|nr:hypothetical protein [Thermoanaerobaculia bacterium]